MARRPRLIAVALLVGLVLVTPALATEGTGRSAPSPAERAAQRARAALAEVSEGVAGIERAIDEVERAIGQIERELAPLETELRTADATFETERRRALRAAEDASAFVDAWSPAPTPTVEELSEPLELIALALHDGDEYRVWLRARSGTL
ncbi:MAG TPA: hypothetical protein VE669_11880, partial [Actinomycetota bacterium]|nr:hypothetical protein [Actinomycetota bacterium]